MSDPGLGRRWFLQALGGLPLLGSAAAGTRLSAADESDFMFAEGLCYLQTGSMGPTPRPVIERVIAVWRELERNPVVAGYGALEEAQDAVRTVAASYLGCSRDEMVLTGSTTEGLNWTAQGLGLKPGDRVVTTDQEHPGGRSCWEYLARTGGVMIDRVAIPPELHDGEEIVSRFRRAISPGTKVMSFSHVLSSTGLRMPVVELGRLARERGVLSVVDGAQAAGGIVVDVKALGVDVYATSGHKWLLGPKGTGLLYLSEQLGRRVDPIALQGGRVSYSPSSGVRNIPGLIGLGSSIEYLAVRGPAAIEAHNLELASAVHAALTGIPKVAVVSGPSAPLASPLVSYRLPSDVPARDLYQRLLDRHRVVVKVVPEEWFNGQRISTHLFNSRSDIDRLAAALRAELG